MGVETKSLLSVTRAAILLFTAVSLATGYERNAYSLVDNKYGDLLIAISDEVPEDLNLIQNIKSAFTLFSRDLFAATRRRAFLGNATILVPKSWSTNTDWEKSTLESFNRANVIVDKANPRAQDNPYVNQPGKCGEPGSYMHLTPRYLTDRRLARLWGPTGKTILHEFGHLRWGFFDEYPIPDEGYRKFYHSVGEDGKVDIEPVRCSKKVYGELKHEETGAKCKTDPTTSLPEKKCTFFPPRDKRKSPAKGSLMFWHFMTYTDSFCDNDTSDTLTLHNDEAPNKHNRLCEGRSQWEIMRDHVDFRGNNNPPKNDVLPVDTTPNFRIVQKGETRLVFVIDVSGSMNTNRRLVKATQAAIEAIRDGLESSAYVALVEFESTARIVHPMVRVTNSSRQSLIAVLSKMTARGSTGIGLGLREAKKVFESNGGTRGGKVILLSDGEENRQPRYDKVLPEMIAAGILVDTILLTKNADPGLISLASQSGGNSFFTTDSDTSTSLVDSFTKAVTEESKESSFVKVFGDTITVTSSRTYSQQIFIDDELGKNTEFVVTAVSADTSLLDVRLETPSRKHEPVPAFDSSKTIRVSIPNIAEPGPWNLSVKSKAQKSQVLQISVTSRSKSPDVKPITLTSEIGQDKVDFNDSGSQPMVIFATLTKGYSPVVDAQVFANVESSKSQYELQLLDNGAGADTTKEDGIYSAYFFNFDGDGGYAVKVKVQDSTGNARVKSSKSSGEQSAVDVCFMEGSCSTPQVVPVYTPVSQVSRVATAGSFQVINQPAPSVGGTVQDLYGPDQITDLVVTQLKYESTTITLQWTAVGDDLVQGQATRYDLRFHSSLQSLRSDFYACSPITQSMVVRGNITQPKPSGETEIFEIRLEALQKEIAYFVAVQAVDDVNKTGDISNIVPFAFTTKEPPQTLGIEPETTTRETATTPQNEAIAKELVLGVALGSVALVAVVVVIIIAVICSVKRSSKLSPIRQVNAHDNPAYNVPV